MRSLRFVLIALLATEPVTFAAVQEKAVSWADFRQEVAQQRLTGRRINVTVSGAPRRVGSVLRRVEAEALVVEENPNTTRWPTADRETRIPRTEVVAVEFLGRKGRGA